MSDEPPRKSPALLPWIVAALCAFGCVWLGQLYFSARVEHAVQRDQQQLADLEIAGARHQAEAERILANRQLADAAKHLDQLDGQVDQATHQLATAQRALAVSAERLADQHRELVGLREKLRAQGDPARLKIATLLPPAGNSSNALAVVVWNPAAQQGTLRVEKLPTLAADQDYRLWLIDPADAAPIDGVAFTVDSTTGGARVAFKPSVVVSDAAKFAISVERKGGGAKPAGVFILLGD